MRLLSNFIFCFSLQKLADIVRDLLQRLFQLESCIPLDTGQVQTSSHKRTTRLPSVLGSLNMDSHPHPNLVRPYGILESDTAFYVVFAYSQFSLWDISVFSPVALNDSYARLLFIVFQILQGVRHCHTQGLSVGNLELWQVRLDQNFWVTLLQPQGTECLARVRELSGSQGQGSESSDSSHVTIPPHVCSDSSPYVAHSTKDLPSLAQRWVSGQLSNFDYLMILNHLAGRCMYDPNHHPIMPWVTDFSSPVSHYRDLTKSKYRLTKGDSQLDLTYDAYGDVKDPLQVSHHIAEVLSDITYYVYKARRIAKSVLCTHVRARWVPHEYPVSMERIQEWSPDECIPEFFTDPEIFQSIHSDLPDLQFPSWADSAADFVEKHQKILEGDYVSRNLHHWIDVTFGYKVRLSEHCPYAAEVLLVFIVLHDCVCPNY